MSSKNPTSGIREEIIDLASRYITIEKTDFPDKGDFFYFQARQVLRNKVLKAQEGWHFVGYGQCRGYVIDEDTKPRGKWVYVYYTDFSQFPLAERVLKMQPPHIVQGTFTTPDRGMEIRITKCEPIKPFTAPSEPAVDAISDKSQNHGTPSPSTPNSNESPANIIKFPKKP